MRHVYSSATNVIARIGEETRPGDKRAVDFVREMSQKIVPWLELPSERRRDLPPDIRVWLRSSTRRGAFETGWLNLQAVISRPWFSRMLVIQEVVMGKEVIVHCGPHQLDWMLLLFCSAFIIQHGTWIVSCAARNSAHHHPEKFKIIQQHFEELCSAARNVYKIGSLFSNKALYSQSHPDVTWKGLITRSDHKTIADLLGFFRTFKAMLQPAPGVDTDCKAVRQRVA
ncbi:hypothetical protein QBC38DRAFT_493877 [Podospora fimiseda]|uniref:Uncharacterized protein n=1 Tax=Podospora fimiseda TaxID=252190 RepID=A0AAN7BER0_9PEZI|nr:hypothetical protein QBC38DRAFT_493877 [Podospora fimiseda]